MKAALVIEIELIKKTTSAGATLNWIRRVQSV